MQVAAAHAAVLSGLAHEVSSTRTLSPNWLLAIDALIAVALGLWLLVLRAPARATAPPGLDRRRDLAVARKHDLAAARAIVERYGEDSIAPFILRPDKSFAFAAGGVLAYRVFGDTAVVSGDPVGPPGSAGAVLTRFQELAREQHWNVVLYGASHRHLDDYRSRGLRSLCVGEEAVADPARFTLEGRAVRKLRQSVNRVERRGWVLTASDGRDIDAATEAEIDGLEARWRASHPRMLGFTMGMGADEGGVVPGDLYLLARAPDGELAATMRFIAHRGKLSLDTMRRVGETPNGLNEALVSRALEVARSRGVSEVSLNYAGLAHLIRTEPTGGRIRRYLTTRVVGLLGRRFQMERLVRFNEKFTPDWRPRYLVYGSRRALAGSVVRVLEAEGYLSLPRRPRLRPVARPWPSLPALESSEARLHGR